MRTTKQNAGNQHKRGRQPAPADEQLLLAYRRHGDESHFAELVARYREPLLHFLKRHVANAEMAEDVLQATFLQLHVKAHLFDEGRKLRPWLYRIAANQAIDAGRRQRRHRAASLNQTRAATDDSRFEWIDALDADIAQPHEDVQQRERGERIRAAVAELPAQLRTIVSLVFFQGLKYREAAEALSIPVGTLKSRMHAALVQLRSEWPDALQPDAA